MHTRRWTTERTGRRAGMLRLGNRDDLQELPSDAVISITHSAGLRLWQVMLNSAFTNLCILPGLAGNPDLLYAELHGDFDALDANLTLTVWNGRGMVAFRDKRAHGWAKGKLTQLVFGGQARTWFLTYRPHDGRIPSADEARRLVESHGKYLEGGRVIRTATRPG